MATMDCVKNAVSNAAESAAKTAKYYAFVSKKRLAILAEKEKIRRNYTKLGKLYYKDFVTDEEPDDAEYLPLCEAISDSYRLINALKEEIVLAREEYRGSYSAEEEDTAENEASLPAAEALTEAASEA